MSLLKKIKADQLAARKAKDSVKALLLSTVIGESEIIGINDGKRESTDAEVIGVVKKFLNNLEENAQRWNHRNPKSQEIRQTILNEISLLVGYVPEQLCKGEIKDILAEQFYDRAIEPSLKGDMMKFLKSKYAGLYDGAIAIDAVSSIMSAGFEKM